MRVLVLGGSGRFGSVVAEILAGAETVSEVVVAERSRDALPDVVAEIGEKAEALAIDVEDEPRLTSVVADFDLVVNATGPEWDTLLPGLRAAVAAGTDYCDFGADGRTTRRQLALDREARSKGVVAVVGMGFDPGLDNLLAVHASARFEHVDDLSCCFHLALPDELLVEAVDAVRRLGRVDTSWQIVLRILGGPARVYREGRWVDTRPLDDPVEVLGPDGEMVTGHPVATPESITLPRYLTGVGSVRSVLSVSPSRVAELMFREAEAIVTGSQTVQQATRSFLEAIAADPSRWLGSANLTATAEGWRMSVQATGTMDGRRARYSARLHPVVESTALPLAVAALRVLRGEVPDRGVFPPEACFEPSSFLTEVAEQAQERGSGALEGAPIIDESLEWIGA